MAYTDKETNMPLKRYTNRYFKKWEYLDPVTNETESILFVANGYLMVYFKQFSGVELTQALEDYQKSLMGLIDKDKASLIAKISDAKDEDKLHVIAENIDEVKGLLDGSLQVKTYGEEGWDLIQLLLFCSRLCALDKADHEEAMSFGLELLPTEAYQDPQLALDILNMAISYDSEAKKKRQS